MLVEIATLPPIVQRYIEAGEKIILSDNGKVVGEFVTSANLSKLDTPKSPAKTVTKSYANGDFSFDLERMKDMMDTEFHELPKFANDEEFLAWVNS